MHPLVLDASSSWRVYVFSVSRYFVLWVGGRRKKIKRACGRRAVLPCSAVLPLWGAGLGPSAVLTLERQVEAEWFDYPKGKTGV